MLFLIAPCGLFAAGFDWLEALLPFLFVAFWILSQVFAVFRRLQGGGRPQPQPQRPRFDPARDRPRPPQPAADEAVDLRGDLEKQIAEFLREATGERKQSPQPPARKTEPVPVTRQQPVRPAQRSEADRRVQLGKPGTAPPRPEMKRPATTVRDAATPRVDVATPSRDGKEPSVARHVQDVFSRELTHLQGTIKQAEARQDDLNRGIQPQSAATQAEELVHLLRSPATIRQVILLREVLDRPVDRW